MKIDDLRWAALRNDPLQHLREEFDREMAVLREPRAADQLRRIFAASPNALADAANVASRKDE